MPHDPRLATGIGIYSRSEVAHLLRMTPSRVTRWIRGYSYWARSRPGRRTSQPAVVRVRPPRSSDLVVLSFVELMELRFVRALVSPPIGFSLQSVRRAAEIAAELFGTPHPFATGRIRHDGSKLLALLSDDTLVELTRQHEQLLASHVIEPFLRDVEFDDTTALASRWWPLGRGVPVVLDPAISFGAPVVEGTATRTDTVALLASHVDAASAAESYGIPIDAVGAAIRFEKELRAAA
jgi:uncharacterized protein (DUF433 family)